jgi:hyperosmotically inducible periplasmic protein
MKRVVAALILTACTACSGQQQSQAQQSVQSAALVTAVKAKLATIDADSTTAVKVDATAGGAVTLTGEARNSAQRSAYESAAASVNGVKRVVDHLQVNPAMRGPKEQFADVALGAKVAANIAAQAGVNAASVKPEVRDGVVTLSGTVPSMSIKKTILDAVRKTSGVETVIDKIEVKP